MSKFILWIESSKLMEIDQKLAKIDKNRKLDWFFKICFSIFSLFFEVFSSFFLVFFYVFGSLDKPKNKLSLFFSLLIFIIFAIGMLYFINKISYFESEYLVYL